MAASFESYEQYQYALKKGKKQVRKARKAGLFIHPEVLDKLVNIHECSMERLGEIDVPESLIVGTLTLSRAVSFSDDFIPLLKDKSEFAAKWRDVCAYHLSDTGIAEAPTAYEYLGKFYIIEGNKRVSVLKSFGAVFISLDVTRLLPPKSNKQAIKRYYKFLDFYSLSKLYTLQFTKASSYKIIQKLLGFDENHVWTRMERIKVVGFYGRLQTFLTKHKIKAHYPDCLVAMLQLYNYEELLIMKDAELDKAIINNKVRLGYGHGPYRIMGLADEENQVLYGEYGKTALKGIDFLISCGDLNAEYLEFLVTITNKPLFYVHGNHDNRFDTNPPNGCTCIDDDLVIYQGIRILGLGGSFRYSRDKYQYTEKEMEKRIRKLRLKIYKARGVDIIVTHAPIKGYGDLEDYAHQGFACYKKLLDDLHPKYWLHGHVHLRYNHHLQRTLEYKETTIVNCYDKYEIIY